MTDGTIALIVTGSILTYLVGIGVTAQCVFEWDIDEWEHPLPIVWPIFLPIWIGHTVVRIITDRSKERALARAEARFREKK